MDGLMKRKGYLEEKLVGLQQERDTIENNKSRLENLINKKKAELEGGREAMLCIQGIIRDKRRTFDLLRSEVKAYKLQKLEERREFYRNKYNETLERMREITITTSLSSFGEYDKLRSLIEKNIFRGLGRRLSNLYNEKRSELKKFILAQMSRKMEDKKKVHELIFYMKFLGRYEEYFGECVMVDHLFGMVSDGFEYHFMCNRDSNRLDKPEWFFEFLELKFAECRELLDMYQRCGGGSTEALRGSAGIEPSFKDILLRSCALIEHKINELNESKSRQRRNLLLHFASQLIKFQSNVFRLYDVFLEFSGFGLVLAQEQKDYVYEKLADIHEARYVTWFNGYKELSKECILYVYKFGSLDSVFTLDYLVDNVIGYNTVFLESLRYIKREEIRVLCHLYSEFEECKLYLLDQENDVVFDSRLAAGATKRTGRGEEGMEMYDVVLTSIEKISAFNHENLKLILSLANNDVSVSLRTIRKIVYAPSETSRNFIVEVSRFLEDYKPCSSYRAVTEMVKERIDSFLLQNVLLKHKLSSEQYFELNDFLQRLKVLFEDKDWRCDVAVKCIGSLFEGRESEGPLFGTIKELYEQNEERHWTDGK
jgi:hypothetical protein